MYPRFATRVPAVFFVLLLSTQAGAEKNAQVEAPRLSLSLEELEKMALAYPQVLIAQRTLFQVRADYVESLVDLWQNAVLIRGMLLAGGLEPTLSAAPIRATKGAPGHPKE